MLVTLAMSTVIAPVARVQPARRVRPIIVVSIVVAMVSFRIRRSQWPIIARRMRVVTTRAALAVRTQVALATTTTTVPEKALIAQPAMMSKGKTPSITVPMIVTKMVSVRILKVLPGPIIRREIVAVGILIIGNIRGMAPARISNVQLTTTASTIAAATGGVIGQNCRRVAITRRIAIIAGQIAVVRNALEV